MLRLVSESTDTAHVARILDVLTSENATLGNRRRQSQQRVPHARGPGGRGPGTRHVQSLVGTRCDAASRAVFSLWHFRWHVGHRPPWIAPRFAGSWLPPWVVGTR